MSTVREQPEANRDGVTSLARLAWVSGFAENRTVILSLASLQFFLEVRGLSSRNLEKIYLIAFSQVVFGILLVADSLPMAGRKTAVKAAVAVRCGHHGTASFSYVMCRRVPDRGSLPSQAGKSRAGSCPTVIPSAKAFVIQGLTIERTNSFGLP